MKPETDHMPPSETDGARLVGMNHVALEVGDIDDALEWYRTLFAFELRSRSSDKAFLDMGDQFIAMAETRTASEGVDNERHLGLVVVDADVVRERIAEHDVEELGGPGLEIRDPWGNRLQIVEYGEIQFTKADHVLGGMDLANLEKSASAIEELTAKGMAPPAPGE